MNSFLSSEVGDRVIGVIDLLDGRAVHAIAGHRTHYRASECCDGNAVTLASQYHNLGIDGLYVADLDSITGGEIQIEAISDICRSTHRGEAVVDIGWSGDESKADRDAVAHLATIHPRTAWIAATESMRSTEALSKLAELVSPQRVFLGLDYRDHKLISAKGDEHRWVQQAAELRCRGAVILDIASVGRSQGPKTLATCQRVKQLAPSLSLYSGGGIRTVQDVRLLVEAGCDQCLVATALYPLCEKHRAGNNCPISSGDHHDGA